MSEPTTVAFGGVHTRPLLFVVRAESEAGLPKKFEFDVSAGFAHDMKREQIHVHLKLAILDADAEPDTPAAEPYVVYESSTGVAVRGLTLEPSAEGEIAPLAIRASVLGIALGTARGMIRANTSGFAISQVELPVISPMQILKQGTPVG